MECKLVPGQHVACIGPALSEGAIILTPGIIFPKIGKVYTIRGVDLSIGDIVVLRLAEIPDQRVDMIYGGWGYRGTLAWLPKAFKPLEKLKAEDFMKTEVPA